MSNGRTLDGEFTGIRQDVHGINTDDSAMISVVHFRIRAAGAWRDGTAIVKQIAGGDYDTDPLEVGSVEYPRDAPAFKYDGFRDLVENYYRSSLNRAIRVTGGAGVRMRDNQINITQPFQVHAVDERAGW